MKSRSMEAPMLSKCANPECKEVFRYLHQGKIFRLSPTPSMHALAAKFGSVLKERFWLCDRCAKELTIVWDGSKARVVPLQKRVARAQIVAFSPGLASSFPFLPATIKRITASIARIDVREGP